MNLRDMKNWWNIAARENAKTAIMSGQSNWDDADFFASGDDWLRGDFEFFSKCVGSRGLVQLSGKYALDFGCGIGRMTRALSRHYERVIGIDISDEMIGRAISANDNQNIEYRVVDRLPLDLNAGPFELVFSTIVIQHISPPHNKDYAKGLMQLVTPGGLILFDAPTIDTEKSRRVGIFGLPFKNVMDAAEETNCKLIGLRCMSWDYIHYQYLFERVNPPDSR